MSTAGDIINGALKTLGILAEGETASAETSQDALEAMNLMIDSWSIERLAVFSTQDQVLTWPQGERTRTLGPTGDLVGNRPVMVDDATYFKDASTGISYGIKIINQQQYDGIAVKTVTSTYPQVMWINMDMPNISVYLYPVPTKALEFHFVSVTELTQPATLATTLVIPPGYARAFKYCLCLEICNQFGMEPPPNIQRLAISSKRAIKRINNPDDIMAIPYSLVGTRQRFNIFAGTPN